jgi:rhodanese-related sulfurtransferase
MEDVMRFIKPSNLNEKSFILDVRSKQEHNTEELKLPHVCKELDELDPLEFIKENNLTPDDTINIICSSGARASQAAEMFEDIGFKNVSVVIGGLVEAEYEGLDIIKH